MSPVGIAHLNEEQRLGEDAEEGVGHQNTDAQLGGSTSLAGAVCRVRNVLSHTHIHTDLNSDVIFRRENITETEPITTEK